MRGSVQAAAIFADSSLVLLSVIMTSKWEYVCVRQDWTARARYSGRLYVGIQMEARGGFTLLSCAGNKTVKTEVQFEMSPSWSRPRIQSEIPLCHWRGIQFWLTFIGERVPNSPPASMTYVFPKSSSNGAKDQSALSKQWETHRADYRFGFL